MENQTPPPYQSPQYQQTQPPYQPPQYQQSPQYPIQNQQYSVNVQLVTNKSKTTALILSIILGGLGIDRFYLGRIGTGILKLLTMGGYGIWTIIDIILIATGKLQPKDGLYKD